MKMSFEEYIDSLEAKIQSSYEDGVTMEVAEKLAAEFLHAQMIISKQLKKVDLDRRMRKSGVRSLRSAVRLSETQKTEKKPTESILDALVDTNELVQKEQDAFDIAEVNKEELERYHRTFSDAHIYYRGIARGNFNG